jgi:hypothetical protein
MPAAGQDFGAADQNARVDTECIADDAEYQHRADAEPAAADRQAKAAAAAATAITAAILDILAFRHVIETHQFLLVAPRQSR